MPVRRLVGGVMRSGIVAALCFVIPVALVAHVLFSWIGFSPTDDGIVLAASRRLLDGQIPHLDFISIRPVGSSLLWLPVVGLAGDYCLWLARLFVWLEFATVAWIWTRLGSRFCGRPFGGVESVLLALIAFAISVHTYILSPWTTLDGLFLASLGVWLCLCGSRGTGKTLGYLLLGSACLCRQTFLALIPAVLVLADDWRQVRYWIAAAIPCGAYAAYLGWNGAWHDAIVQFSARSALFKVGVMHYVREGLVPWGAICGWVAMRAVLGASTPGAATAKAQARRRQFGVAALYLAMVVGAAAIGIGKSSAYAFPLFGCAIGCTCCMALRQGWRNDLVRVGILALTVAWITSISAGYDTPALGVGLFAPLIAGYCRSASPSGDRSGAGRRLPLILTLGVAVLAMLSLARGRTHYPYRDLPASALTEPLGAVLAGGKEIRTNPTTYGFLLDLDDAIKRCGSKPYAIVPDVAAHWIRSAQQNPLSIDWVSRDELTTRPLMDRVLHDIIQRRGSLVIIVGKMRARSLVTAEPSIDVPEEDVTAYVKASWRRTGETNYFELYE